MSVEIWMVNVILMRSQMEIKNMSLDNGRKAIFVNKLANNLVNCVSILVFYRGEFVSIEIIYVAEVTSKQSVEGECPGFS